MFSTNENVSICNDYRVSYIVRIGGKFSRWGKNSLVGIKTIRWARARQQNASDPTLSINNSIFVCCVLFTRDPEKMSRSIS